MKKYFIPLFLLLAACSNNAEQKEQWPVDMDEIVTLHCKSIELKNARFSLADSIRFVQDSIRINEAQNDRDLTPFLNKLDHFEAQKEMLTKESYDLSDSIEAKMEKIIRTLSLDEKRVFNDSLIARTKAMGCI